MAAIVCIFVSTFGCLLAMEAINQTAFQGKLHIQEPVSTRDLRDARGSASWFFFFLLLQLRIRLTSDCARCLALVCVRASAELGRLPHRNDAHVPVGGSDESDRQPLPAALLLHLHDHHVQLVNDNRSATTCTQHPSIHDQLRMLWPGLFRSLDPGLLQILAIAFRSDSPSPLHLSLSHCLFIHLSISAYNSQHTLIFFHS